MSNSDKSGAGDSASRVYNLGDTGPGGGLVFMISGGKTYEMAPKAWGAIGVIDPSLYWCDTVPFTVTGTDGTAIGDGFGNTAALFAAGDGKGHCGSDAVAAVLAFRGTDDSAGQWFIPSKDELNAMYGYKSLIVDTTKYGFANVNYWGSSQFNPFSAWFQFFGDGIQGNANKNYPLRVRPIRAF